MIQNRLRFRKVTLSSITYLWVYNSSSFSWVESTSLPGGSLRYRGGPHLRYVFRGRRGLFLRHTYVRDFVKEGYFFVPRYEVWGSKSPYNPRNIRGSDAEWLGFRVCCRHFLPLNKQRIIDVFPFIQCQCFDKRRGVYLVEKISVLLK